MEIYKQALRAMHQKDYAALTKLAEEGSLDQVDENGWTVYSWAVLSRDVQSLAILEQYKVNKGKWQDALLICGSEENDVEAIKLALQNGADLEYKHYHGTALERAADNGNPEAVRVLIEYGAKIPPDILFMICHWELADWKIGYPEHVILYAEVVRILIDAGVDPNLTIDGETAADGIAGDGLYAIEAELKRPKQ